MPRMMSRLGTHLFTATILTHLDFRAVFLRAGFRFVAGAFLIHPFTVSTLLPSRLAITVADFPWL